MFCIACGAQARGSHVQCQSCGAILVARLLTTPGLLSATDSTGPRTRLTTARGRFRIADFNARLGGHLTDAILALTVLGIVWVVYFADYRLGFNRTLEAVGAMLAFGLFWTLNATGWSPGKRAVGIRVIAHHGGRPGVLRGLVRTIGAVVSAAPLGAGYLWAAWDGSRRTWHDRLAGTHVVWVEQDMNRPPPVGLRSHRDLWLGPRP